MPEQAVFVVVEVVAVKDPAGLRTYAERSTELIGLLGGTVVARGSGSVDGEAGFGPMVVQHWTSEDAFRTWLASDAYRPLSALRQASATMKVAIVPIVAPLAP